MSWVSGNTFVLRGTCDRRWGAQRACGRPDPRPPKWQVCLEHFGVGCWLTNKPMLIDQWSVILLKFVNGHVYQGKKPFGVGVPGLVESGVEGNPAGVGGVLWFNERVLANLALKPWQISAKMGR